MAENALEQEVIEITEHIENGKNFLLSGGAGSGKTYSLIQVINETFRRNPSSRIACITYTNAAANEIKSRIDQQNLSVSTIHDFLWNNISSFQSELKKCLIELINEEESKIKNPEETSIPIDFYDHPGIEIRYREHVKIKDGIVSHDEVLILANRMLKNHPLLGRMIKDKYPYIFVDEYQDTDPLVIDTLLDHFKHSKNQNIVGFFGDSMQSIFPNGVGDLKDRIDNGELIEVQKKQNRRNPKLVIELANQLRTDGLQQEPSQDDAAPNMLNGQIKQGSIKFLYSNENDIEKIKSSEYFANWNFTDSKETKELNLTHNLIATKAGFPNLMAIYDKDPIIAFKNKILSRIKKQGLLIDDSLTFDEVVDLVAPINRQKKLKKDEMLSDPTSKILYDKLKDLTFSEVKIIYLTKDSLIDDKKQDSEDESKKGSKRDNLIKHLFKIQKIVQYYTDSNYNDFIRATNFTIDSIQKKRELREIIKQFLDTSGKSILEIYTLPQS
jgi:ATP-dependent DNA helicase UvrD/PcrA